jgi:hypothetical protein
MKETLGRILALLQPQKHEMLSLGDIRSLLRPDSETYKGMQTVLIAKIVGSEGRYKDFNKAFLPRHDKLMRRWMSVDEAHYRNITLPPIKLFEIGGAFFVRDGNHRVSVARAQGQEFIDAEVTSLSSEIPLTPDMTREEIKRAVIDFEKRRFFQSTKLDRHRPGCSLELTEVGRFDELRAHIQEHKWYINLDKLQEIPFDEAAASWYDNVYLPIVTIIRESKLLSRFPGATEADLYVYIGKHWAELNARYGPLFTLEEAAEDFSATRHSFAVLKAARSVLGRLGSLFRLR